LTRSLAGSVIVLGAVLVLFGCSRKPEAQAAASSPATTITKADPTWCNRGGLDAAKDPNCKRQADQDLNKFIGKGGGT
jgi:hypothetical protein